MSQLAELNKGNSILPAKEEQTFTNITPAEPMQLEELLTRTNRELKLRLEERALELAKANKQLREEARKRKHIEVALHESEQRFISFMNHSPLMTFIKDDKGRYIYGNKRWQSVFGKGPASSGDRTDFDLYPHEIALRIRKEDRDILTVGKNSETVRTHISSKGQTNSWLTVKFPFMDPRGRPFVGGVAVDITERKRAAAALKAHAAQQAVIAEFGQHALTDASAQSLMDESAILVSATLGVEFCAVMELLPEENALLLKSGVSIKGGLIGHTTIKVNDQSHEEYVLNRRKPIRVESLSAMTRFKPCKLLLDHGMVSGMDVIIPGLHKPLGILSAYTGTPRVFSRDEMHFLQAIANSLAAAIEQRRANWALRQSENNLADFFDNAPLGLHWLGPDGRILRANKAELRMLGYKPEEYIGQHISKFHLDQDVINDVLAKLATNQIHNYEARLRCKDGTTKHVLTDLNVLWEEGRFVHARCFSRDVTDRRQRERQILEISEREQQRIGQDLHDELCQYLAAIKFKCGFLKRKLTRKSTDQMREAGLIEEMLNRAIDQAHSLARGLCPVQLDANGLTSALKELATHLGSVYQCHCSFQIKKPVLVHDNIVAIHLYRIAQEAMTNAIKHGKASKIIVSLIVKGERLILSVEDNGVGFAPNKFSQTGMGLHLMKYRSRFIGATLDISSRPKSGTILTCTLVRPNPPTTNQK
ncbi:MAG: Multi-sensor signal transduction histidine kinase [Pedosphaera sp.]|nr:Multi-sensor signal transduction histidine kinase [Pedosphaera sp.]